MLILSEILCYYVKILGVVSLKGHLSTLFTSTFQGGNALA